MYFGLEGSTTVGTSYAVAIHVVGTYLTAQTLSAGLGQQTLGEEYCDLLQVSGSKLGPSAAQRASQVLYQTVLPLVHAKLARAAPPEDSEAYVALRGTQADALSATKHTDESECGNGHDVAPLDALWSPPSSEAGTAAHALNWSARAALAASQPSTSSALASAYAVRDALTSLRVHVAQQACRLWSQRWRAAVVTAAWLPLLSQLHLALFYLRGVYLEVPKRASGVRMVYIGAMDSARKYYGVMGVLLLLQVAVRALQRLRCVTC